MAKLLQQCFLIIESCLLEKGFELRRGPTYSLNPKTSKLYKCQSKVTKVQQTFFCAYRFRIGPLSRRHSKKKMSLYSKKSEPESLACGTSS
jgi:hypothetical protein